MYKFSFKVIHKNCDETAFSKKFPKLHITVVDIQSRDPRRKQYFYYITGNNKLFDAAIKHLKKTKSYELVREVERSKDTLMLVVMLNQKSYIQNIIQKYNGFFLELHTVYEGWEYWHIGVINKDSIGSMLNEFRKMGELKVLYIGEAEFSYSLLSEQQKKVFLYAHENGYYEIPRKITIKKIASALKLNPATAGEHLLKAENKMINSVARKI